MLKVNCYTVYGYICKIVDYSRIGFAHYILSNVFQITFVRYPCQCRFNKTRHLIHLAIEELIKHVPVPYRLLPFVRYYHCNTSNPKKSTITKAQLWECCLQQTRPSKINLWVPYRISDSQRVTELIYYFLVFYEMINKITGP